MELVTSICHTIINYQKDIHLKTARLNLFVCTIMAQNIVQSPNKYTININIIT